MTLVVFLFHRDLRIVDHRGLERATELARTHSAKVLPLFIFTPQQIDRNPLRSSVSVQFMIDSLADLSEQIHKHGGSGSSGGHLRFAHGDTVEVLKGIKDVVAIVETKDYTPFAKRREAAIREMCEHNGIQYDAVEDIYITPPGTIKTGTGRPYQKFTPFWQSAKQIPVPKPKPAPKVPWITTTVTIPHSVTLHAMEKVNGPRNAEVQLGGRTEGLKNLKAIPKSYDTTHDMMPIPTSELSAHNHYGTVSIREVYWATTQEGFRRQLYWRDFYGQIMAMFEELYHEDPYAFQAPTKWRKGEQEIFNAWSKGETGIPLIDAAMHQLLRTGFMHNRARMLVASWLVKDKGVHWRWGERWFAKHLVDYDPAQNMMNWIWIASVLPFASAPFRRHDPDRYAERFDPDGEYRKKWLPDSD